MMLSLEEALERILSRIRPLDSEEIGLAEADGRVLAKTLKAGISLPIWDNSAMDGYAVRAEDVRLAGPEHGITLQCLGETPAGQVSEKTVTAGTCLRLFTGSPMPEGADAVVMQEDTRVDPATPDAIAVLDAVRPFENVRFRGDDIREGALMGEEGTRLSAFHVTLAAATGVARCRVYRRPRVGILATGSELCEPGESLSHGKIYESNRLLIQSLVRRAGAEARVYPIVEDRLEATRDALQRAAEECDAVVTSGGVSVGDYDFVKPAIESLGGNIHFWRMRVKPGKPLVFGEVQSVPVFGLPGNPVSATVTFTLVVHPALARLGGVKDFKHTLVQGTLERRVNNPGDRRFYLRVCIDEAGVIRSSGTAQASHALGTLAASDGLLAIPEASSMEAGSPASVLLWPRLA